MTGCYSLIFSYTEMERGSSYRLTMPKAMVTDFSLSWRRDEGGGGEGKGAAVMVNTDSVELEL